MPVVRPLLQGVTIPDALTDRDLPNKRRLVCCFKTPSEATFPLTCRRSSSLDIYRTNSKHKAKHEAMWGENSWRAGGGGELHKTASSGVWKATQAITRKAGRAICNKPVQKTDGRPTMWQSWRPCCVYPTYQQWNNPDYETGPAAHR